MYRKFITSSWKTFTTMSRSEVIKSPTKTDYEACIDVLNSLQSNAQYIRNNSSSVGSHNSLQLQQVEKYLLRSGLNFEKLDKLSVIHVAGTKGKGTTCAFTERILREHGFKTGFFSSPHLIEVRERIRINGEPISHGDFSHFFWRIYNQLVKAKENEFDMPLYFRFLTIMGFMVFIEKKVDVAIIEVGIGGEYDCTNILRKVPVVGITSLGIDHTSLLGPTIETIAWNKAGIMKKGSTAFTVSQPDAAMKILQERSIEKECQLNTIDNLINFKIDKHQSIPENIFNLNASLAIALAEEWLKKIDNTLSKEVTEKALAACQWPGRFHIKTEKNLRFFLDGAHTLESIEQCANWFHSKTAQSNQQKALVFNITGDRNSAQLLNVLKKCEFDVALFVTNQVGNRDNLDNNDFISIKDVIAKCEQHRDIWLKINKNTSNVRVFPNVRLAIDFLHSIGPADVLTTGSIHLIGAVLTIIEPDLLHLK